MSFNSRLNSQYGPGFHLKVRKLKNFHEKCANITCNMEFLMNTRDNNITPKCLLLKDPIKTVKSKSILARTSNILRSELIKHHRCQKYKIKSEIYNLTTEIKNTVSDDDYNHIMACMDITYKCREKQNHERHNKKLTKLLESQVPRDHTTDNIQGQSSRGANPTDIVRNSDPSSADIVIATTTTPTNTETRAYVNLSSHSLTEEQKSVLNKGLKFALSESKPTPIDIISSIEYTTRDIEHHSIDEFKWKMKGLLTKYEKKKVSPRSQNITKNEKLAIKQLRENNDIIIRPADKGGKTVVMDKADYTQKMTSILNSNDYEIIPGDPTKTIEGRVYRTLAKHRDEFSDEERRKFQSHYSKPHHIYGNPKIHKEGAPLRPIVSTIGGPMYNLCKYLHTVLTPIVEGGPTYLKNSTEFVNKVRTIELEENHILASLDVVNLFGSVQWKVVIKIIQDILEKEPHKVSIHPSTLLELLTLVLSNNYFQFEDKFYKQKGGLPMGSPLSPVLAEILMQHFENRFILNHSEDVGFCVRYVDDGFLIWKSGRQNLEDFLKYLNTCDEHIKFTMEIENDNKLPYLDTLVYKENRRLVTTIYKKPTHSAQYITAQSNHPIHVKRGVIKTLTHRIHRLCMKEEDRKKELKELEKELKQNGHSTKFIRNAMQDRRRRTDDTPQLDPIATLQIPYIKGFAEKVRSWAKDVNIRVCFSSKHTIRRSLCGTKPTNINIDDKGSIYCIPLSCGKRYVGESGRPLNVRLKEHKDKIRKGGTTGSYLVQHLDGCSNCQVDWTNVTTLTREQHTKKRKIIETGIINSSENAISSASVDVHDMWLPFFKQKFKL
ncbi:hypothetical protein M8J77_022402 [Diaphorina citri]|nr:hypothetical protein M8J77_022402 [Diaphorina citri]